MGKKQRAKSVEHRAKSKGQKAKASMLHAICPALSVLRSKPSALFFLFIALCSLLFALSSPAFAEGVSGWANLNQSTTKQYEDNKRKSAQESFNRNIYLRLDKSVTPALNYQLYLRTTLIDNHSTDAEGRTTDSYQRTIEPTIDFFLRNPMYSFDTGYRRQEQWSTAHFSNEGRRTTDFYYSRLNITPFEFPTFLLQYDRQKEYDHISASQIDTTSDRYSGSTGYQFSYKDLSVMYNFYLTRTENKTPLSITNKTITDNFTGTYNIGYTKALMSGRVTLSAVYQGNFSRNKNQTFAGRTGSETFERTPQTGLRAKGDDIKPDVDILSSDSSLVDNNFSSGISALNIGLNGSKYNNIGIQLLFEKSVDKLFVYVNKNIASDTILASVSNWKAYRSNSNTTGSWTEISIQSVNIAAYDAFNSIYRYEISFTSSQSALYFKLVNMNIISGVSDVLVTEIEAYGTDVISQTGVTTDVVTLFNQGLSFNANIKPFSKLNFSLNYYINKNDNNPESVLDSVGGIVREIFSKSSDPQQVKMKSNITRTYGVGSTWMAHKLFTPTVRIQRNESYDNKKETDTATNTYSLSLPFAPLQTLSANLSFIRSDNFSFDIKQSTSESILLNIGTKLYKDVNMITDIGYTNTQSLVSGTASTKTQYVRGTIDASFTPKLFGTFNYGFTETISAGTTTKSTESGMVITYRPARFVNLSGTFRISESGNNKTITEGFFVDWMPLPATKLNFNYQHVNSEPGPTITDTLSSYLIWYITKFLDLQLTYNHTLNKTDKKTETYNLGLNLNCRFW